MKHKHARKMKRAVWACKLKRALREVEALFGSSKVTAPASDFAGQAMPETNVTLLRMTLLAAVPLWIAKMRSFDDQQRSNRAAVCGQVVAEKGDLLMFKSKKKGGTAEVFNRLAEGLACAAYSPGGVKFAGLHFEA